MAESQLRNYLQGHFKSSVEFSDVHVDLYPGVRVIVDGLVLRHQGRTDIPPLIQVTKASVDSDFMTLVGRHHVIKRVTLEGLQIHTPPRTPGGPPMFHGTDTNLAEKFPVVIEEIDANDALVVLLRKPADAGKPPNEFPIHQLVMHDFSFDRPAAFHALLTNPKPKGEIHCDGEFGPWRADEPSETPVSGKYTFYDADLGTLKGLRGILSSVGNFSGPLDYLDVNGETDTPDFALRTSGHPMALHTDYKAIVDGTNGNTVLTNVVAKFLHTTLVAHGEIVDVRKDIKSRTIVLDAVSTDARIEDLLTLAVKSDKPSMTGSARLTAKILIPESDEDMIERLQVDGQFGFGAVHFTSSGVQGKVDSLSRKGQGKPKDLDIIDEMSDLKGRFKLQNAVVTFSDLTFAVEGASVALAGTYNIDSSQMDFRGKLRMDAKLSQATTGWKSVVLKPFDHFFKGPNGGSEIPIKITGTRDHPTFGADFHDKVPTKQ
jgi:AsmA-like C-terminal region